jgi:hypothetical protein
MLMMMMIKTATLMTMKIMTAMTMINIHIKYHMLQNVLIHCHSSTLLVSLHNYPILVRTDTHLNKTFWRDVNIPFTYELI